MGARRALAGTREGYRQCPTCRHMIIRHANHGNGPCLQQVPEYWRDQRNRTQTTWHQCTCTGPTTENEG